MRERDEFEAWAKSRFYLDQIGGESEQADEYAFDTTDAAWKAWQAARAPQAVPALTGEVRKLLTHALFWMGREPISKESTDGMNAVRADLEALLLAAPQPPQEQPARQKYQD